MTSPAQSTSSPVATFLARLALAPRQSHKLLTVWPLRRGDASEARPYVTLTDALARGEVEISELRDGARVAQVLVSNRGDAAVLVLFGEELRGALQNRTANASFLVAPRAEIEIDVSCVEQGRWSSRGARGFRSDGGVVSSSMRAKMALKVARSLRRGVRFDADQGEVWESVAERVSHARARSMTGAYSDYLDTRARELAEATAAFTAVPGQVGFVAMLGDEVLGLEAIGRPEVFARAFPGLLRGYLVDAIDASLVRASREAEGAGAIHAGDPARAACFESPEAFLAALGKAPAQGWPSLGLGTDLRVAGHGVCGCALVDGEIVHLTAFCETGRASEA